MAVSLCAAQGDLLVIGRRSDDSVLVRIVQGDSTIANQVLWLFHVNLPFHRGFLAREELETEQDRIQFASRFILEHIGIPVETLQRHISTKYFNSLVRPFRVLVSSLLMPDPQLKIWTQQRIRMRL
jgi:hypothetical protein